MDKSGTNPLEQFVLLSKTAKGAAAAELVKQATEAPGVYVFGELIDMPNIKEVGLLSFNDLYCYFFTSLSIRNYRWCCL